VNVKQQLRTSCLGQTFADGVTEIIKLISVSTVSKMLGN